MSRSLTLTHVSPVLVCGRAIRFISACRRNKIGVLVIHLKREKEKWSITPRNRIRKDKIEEEAKKRKNL
jgi:hypothetical protein